MFLQWALPQLGLSWPGFRKVRRQVCKRIAARIRALSLADAAAYRSRLEVDLAEGAAHCHMRADRAGVAAEKYARPPRNRPA